MLTRTAEGRPPMTRTAGRSARTARVRMFAMMCGIAIAVAAGYLVWTLRQETAGAAKLRDTSSPDAAAALLAQPHVLFLDSDGDTYRRVALAPLAMGEGARVFTAA